MASSIYNHKHLQPAGAAPQGGPSIQAHHASNRIDEAFGVVRGEFEQLARELEATRVQRDEFENKLTGQVNELNIIRSSLYALEDEHRKVRGQYEDEMRKLQDEFRAYKQRVEGPRSEGIASLGRGDRDRDRDRERDRDRDRDRERDMRLDREPPAREPINMPGPPSRADARDGLGLGRPLGIPGAPPAAPQDGQLGGLPHAPPVGLGVGAGPGGGGGYEPFYPRGDRDRERDREERMAVERGRMDSRILDRERDLREREMRDQRERERERIERERERDIRAERERADVKRIKTERGKMERSDPFSPSLPSVPGQPPHQSIALAPAPGGPGPLPPHQSPQASHNVPTSGPSGPPPGPPGQSSHPTPKLPPAPGPGGYGPPTPQAGPSAQPPTPSALHQPGPPTTGPGGPPPALSTLNPAGPSALSSPSNGMPLAPSSLPLSQLPPPPSSQPSRPPQQSQDRDVTMTDAYSGPIADMEPNSLPPEMKKEGSDWFAVFNPNASKETKKKLDVNLVHTLSHESVVCCVRFSADGKYLATGCNRTAQIYDTKTGQKTCVLVDEDATKTGDLYIRSVCFSPDGRYLATGAEDKQIRIWDIANKHIRNIFEGHQQEIYSLDFSKDGRLIVSGSGDKTAKIWDMTEQGLYKTLSIDEPDSVDAGVTSVCISPDGTLVAAGSLDTVVRIWDVQTGKLVERLKGHRDSVYSVAFTPDGRGLVSGSLDKTLKYWDVQPIYERRRNGTLKNGAGAEKLDKTSQCLMNFTGHKDYVLSVAVSHDGQWVVSGSKDRGVQFWDSKSAVVQCMLQGHKNSVISIDLSPVGNLLATGSGDWQARIWSYTTTPATGSS